MDHITVFSSVFLISFQSYEATHDTFLKLGDTASDLNGNRSIAIGERENPKADILYNQVNSTEVNITANLVQDEHNIKTFIYLTCSSCRVPYKHRAEFLIDKKSIDTIILDPSNNFCYSSDNRCNPKKCNCSATGNTFMRMFDHTEMNSIYSCDMVFNDIVTGARFSKIASIYVNDTGVFPLPSETIVIKHPPATANGTSRFGINLIIVVLMMITLGWSSMQTQTISLELSFALC